LTIKRVERLWKSVDGLDGRPNGGRLHVAPSNSTRASLIKELQRASTRLVLSASELHEYHSLLVASTEFSVFLPTFDEAFLSTLTNLFDCEDEYRETRVEEDRRIPHPQLHILGGTTPGWLASTFPELAWSMGFSARLILVHSEEPQRVALFGTVKKSDSIWASLVLDAKLIAKLYGRLTWTKGAEAVITAWYDGGCRPIPDHPRLVTYNVRRLLMVLKLTIIACVSRTSDFQILDDDVVTAMAWLLEAEQHMGSIFKNMGGAHGGSVLAELHHFARTNVSPSGTIIEGRLINFLSSKVHIHQIRQTLELALANGMLTKEGNLYRPASVQ